MKCLSDIFRLKMEKTKIGINYIGYGYNAHNGRKVQEYNRYQMYDGQHGNFSLDISSVIGKVRIFAETALDYGGNFAIVCGVISRIAGWHLRSVGPHGFERILQSHENQRGTAGIRFSQLR